MAWFACAAAAGAQPQLRDSLARDQKRSGQHFSLELSTAHVPEADKSCAGGGSLKVKKQSLKCLKVKK